MYLFGKTYPGEINVPSNKYLGAFGVGYQYTDKGIYLIMEVIAENYNCKITSIEEVAICFDPTNFKKQEDEFRVKRAQDLQKMREKIARD